MSCGITAILYFYLKQKLFAIETRLNTLTELAQTLATELYNNKKEKFNPLETVVETQDFKNVQIEDSDENTDSEEDSDDSDSDSDDSDSDDSVDEVKIQTPDFQFKEIKLEEPLSLPREFNELVIDISEPIVVQKREPEKLIEVSDDELDVKVELENVEPVSEDVKHISVDTDISNLSLKDLKQKVIDLGGPPLKTKQALLNFLKKKV
jgi:hypothetical protein